MRHSATLESSGWTLRNELASENRGALNPGHATAASKPGASSLRCTNVRFVLTAAPGDGDEVGPRGVRSHINARR